LIPALALLLFVVAGSTDATAAPRDAAVAAALT
jgi:hypothetical protein